MIVEARKCVVLVRKDIDSMLFFPIKKHRQYLTIKATTTTTTTITTTGLPREIVTIRWHFTNHTFRTLSAKFYSEEKRGKRVPRLLYCSFVYRSVVAVQCPMTCNVSFLSLIGKRRERHKMHSLKKIRTFFIFFSIAFRTWANFHYLSLINGRSIVFILSFHIIYTTYTICLSFLCLLLLASPRHTTFWLV